jgi:YidC/Oxa1 family membrane protein insertase
MMDIQRLILYAIFFSSAFFLWTAWQQEHAPPPAPAATKAAQPAAPGDAASVPAPPKDVPLPQAGAPLPGATTVPTAPAAAAPKVTVTTDLYTAEVDTVGGVISLVSLAKHQDATDRTKPYRVLQSTPDRTFVAQMGLIGAGMPNHQTRWEVLPGPRELAPGSERVELRLQATAADGS